MNDTDEALYAQYRKLSDNEALRVLLERHREGLTLFLYGYVHSMEDAEELMLDAFAEVAAGPTLFSGRSSFKTWLVSIGKHLALTHLRRQRSRVSALPLSEELSGPSAELELLRGEQTAALYRALERLSPEYRQTLLLIYVEGMTHAEAAKILGKRVKQVYNLADRGKQALRKELERMGFQYANL